MYTSTRYHAIRKGANRTCCNFCVTIPSVNGFLGWTKKVTRRSEWLFDD